MHFFAPPVTIKPFEHGSHGRTQINADFFKGFFKPRSDAQRRNEQDSHITGFDAEHRNQFEPQRLQGAKFFSSSPGVFVSSWLGFSDTFLKHFARQRQPPSGENFPTFQLSNLKHEHQSAATASSSEACEGSALSGRFAKPSQACSSSTPYCTSN